MSKEISAFSRQLKAYWSGQPDTLRTPAPDIQELLLEILPTIFWASLETEEGRPLSYSLAIHDGTGDYGDDISEWLFERPRAFNEQELRRLAPAVDSLQTFIVIDRNRESGKPEMRGLLGIGRVYSEAIRASNPSLPSVDRGWIFRADGPGVIHLYHGSRLVARYNRGDVHFDFPSSGMYVFERTVPVLEWYEEFIQHDPESSGTKAIGRHTHSIYINAIVAVLNQVDAHRHGGAVIVVPAKYRERMREMGARYQFSPECQFLRQRVLETLRTYQEHADSLDKDGSANDHEFKSTFSRMADESHLVGDLSGSDGAIILGTDLELLGAGAQLPIDAVRDRRVMKIQIGYLERYLAGETEHATPALGDHIGMRHRSALSFVLQNPDAVAFVVSQDGGITVICRPIVDQHGNRHKDVMVILGVRVWAAHLASA